MTGMSDDLVEDCRTDMLHNDMDLYHLMVHAHEVEESRFNKQKEMPRGNDPMIYVLIRVSLKSKTNQSFRSHPPTMFLRISQGLTNIVYLTLSLKV